MRTTKYIETNIRFVVGDVDFESHGRTAEIVLGSNVTEMVINQAFQESLKANDFDWRMFSSSEFFASKEQTKQLLDMGFKANDKAVTAVESFIVTCSLLLSVYIFLVQKYDPSIRFWEIKSKDLYIGGKNLSDACYDRLDYQV